MMSYLDRRWACPFYRYDERQCVHCERGSKLKFPDMTAEIAYVDRHCASVTGWRDCTLAQCLTNHYERMDKIKDEANQR